MEEIIIGTDFKALEAALSKIESASVAYWVGVWDEYKAAKAAQAEGVTLSVRAWSMAWQAAVKTRSAQAVQQTLSLVKWADEAGYDMGTFSSLEHIKECKNGKPAPKAEVKKSAKARRLAVIQTAAFKALPAADQAAVKAVLGID